MRLLHRDQHHDADHTEHIVDAGHATRDDRDGSVVIDPVRESSTASEPTRITEAQPLSGGQHVSDVRTVSDEDVRSRRTVDATSTSRGTTVHERTWTFAPGQLVSFVAGLGVIVVGVIALLRAGIDGSLARPTVDVLGYSHTAWLGLAEVALGLLLVVAGTGAWGRPLSVLLGAAGVVAGVIVLAETDQLPDELGLEKDFGWPLIVLGAVVALAAMALPVWRRRHLREQDIVDLRDRELEGQRPAHL